MKLYHATPKRNLESIQSKGLAPNRANGKEKLVWLHTATRPNSLNRSYSKGITQCKI